MSFDRITVERGKLEGQPCIRGLRITVGALVRLTAGGWTVDQILESYPNLELEDVTQALAYAAEHPLMDHVRGTSSPTGEELAPSAGAENGSLEK